MWLPLIGARWADCACSAAATKSNYGTDEPVRSVRALWSKRARRNSGRSSPYFSRLLKKNIMEYMSQEGYDKLVAELHQLESVELPQVREAIAEARDKGDLSENFEYHAAKREQGRLLGRIRFKQRVLANARVIDMSRLNSDSVQLLSRVEMTNLNNQSRMTYTIASPHEANLREGKISIKSPIAQALLHKKVGDIVEVRVPAGMLKLRIENIQL